MAGIAGMGFHSYAENVRGDILQNAGRQHTRSIPLIPHSDARPRGTESVAWKALGEARSMRRDLNQRPLLLLQFLVLIADEFHTATNSMIMASKEASKAAGIDLATPACGIKQSLA